MTRKLILHIGNHKTGTTSIQSFLFSKRAELSRKGYDFFCTKKKDPTKTGAHALNGWISANDNCFQTGSSPAPSLSGFLARGINNVIASSEDFAWFFEPQTIDKFIVDCLKSFDKIHVVAYVRRQDKQLVSHHQQASKGALNNKGWGRTAKFYGSSARAIPTYSPHFDQYYNFDQRIGLWASAVGEQNITVRSFDRNQLLGGDVVEDFCQAAQIPLKPEPYAENRSTGFIRSKVSHLANQLDGDITPLLEPIRKLNNSGKLLPSREDAHEFYARYRESNLRLNQRFKITTLDYLFDEDFTAYDDKPGDLWDEHSANEAILTLLKHMQTSLPHSRAGAIQKPATILAKVHLALAERLTRILGNNAPLN